jgi:fucose-1-phosphate guanylyltransferase
MNVCCLLRELYGDKIDGYRILLINCGGQSQRLPSASILGKIFMALPIGSPPLSLFEFKLFCYLPFLERMSPGYMHVASDTIEVFDLSYETNWSFDRPGFTAAAHPSSLDIGATHGVYVLTETTEGNQQMTEMRECLSVLQKPSIERMRERHAVLKTCENGRNTEFVYTDSFFFFDHHIAKLFERFYQAEAPFDCEIDAYADFLQSLGPEATIEFARDLRNVSNVEPKLVEMREKIFHLLKGTQLNIVAMNCSKFYHLGTMKEYIFNFCEDEIIQGEMGFTQNVFCKFIDDKATQKLSPPAGCVIHSVLPASSEIAQTAIVEFCTFPSNVSIGSNCVISSCSAAHNTEVNIPSDVFMHTVAFQLPSADNVDDTSLFYATVLFHINDNIKKKPDENGLPSLPYMGTTLEAFTKLSALKLGKIFGDSNVHNLWFARLFPAFRSMEESLRCSLDIIRALREQKQCHLTEHCMVSMANILLWKDASAMLTYREQLYKKIIS